MAAGPGVAMQSGSPARELPISVQQGGNHVHGDRIKSEEVTESEKQSRMAALLEKLHAKHNASRPWQETCKVVRQAMEKRSVMNAAGHQLVLTCLETLQRALKVSSLPSMTDRLESIARQNLLGSHLSPSGTECYITSDMFYVEVQLDTNGQLVDVKVAHQGENPTSCPELIQHLREKNFEEFSKHLKGLVELYKLPGDNKLKTKMYIALQSLELDLTKMMHMFRLATNANAVETILHGGVGLLTARSGGHLVSLQCYVSPYDLFDEGLSTQLNIPDGNIPRSLGVSVFVTIEGTSAVYKLPITPLITGSHPVDNKGTPSFSTVTNSNCVDLPACFFLKMNRPMPFSRSFIQRLGNATSIPVFESPPSLSPLYQLIVHSQHQLSKEGSTAPLPSHNMHFYSVLPDQQHCYFLNGDAPVQDGRCLQGALVSKIPFRHPGQVPLLLDIIRHQAAYNNLVGSCVKRTSIKEDSAGLLQFEVCPLTDSSFSVSFQHPVNESLVCVVMEVIDSRQVSCKLYKGLSDALICTDEFITKVVQRCMSIPVSMRAIRRKAETIQADTPALSLIAQTVEIMVKNNLPPSSSPTYNMAVGDGTNPMGLPGLAGGNTPTGAGLPGGPNFGGPINSLFGVSRTDRQASGGECLAQGGAGQQQSQQPGQGHADDFNKVTQNPILTSLLQITGNVGSSPSSQNAPQPHQTPPPTSSPASNTKNHPMLMNLLKDNPTQDFATLYASSPLERPNSSSGSPRTESMGGSCPGSGTKGKKKRPRVIEKGSITPGTAPGGGVGGLGMKGSSMPPHHPHHPVSHEDDFHRELLSMDVDASQNSIFDVNLTGDGLDTPHSITPAPSQCGTPPSGPNMPYSQSHVQAQQQQQQQQQQQPPGAVPPRMVRLSSSDSIGPDITEILSDLPEQTGKVSGGSHGQHPLGNGGEDGGPLGTPIRDSSSSGQGSAVFDSADIFNTNSNENPFTDAADLIAEATATAATPTSDSSSTNFFPDAADFNPDLLNSGHGFSQNYFDDSSPSADGDMDLVKGFGGSSQQNTPSGTPQNPTPHGQRTPEPSIKDPFDMGIVFGGNSGGGKPLLGQAPDLGDPHGGGSQSPLIMGLATACAEFKSVEPKMKQVLMRPKDENGASGGSSSVMGSSSTEGKQVKRSRTPSSEGKAKEKPAKRKKLDTDGKSPSHSSGGRPYTPPSGGSGSGGSISGGGSKSPGSSGRSQTPPGGATPPIPKITIQIAKGTITGGKTSSHSGYTSSSSATSSTGGAGGTGGSKSHHSHSSSSGKIKSKEGSGTQGNSSKPGSTGMGGGGGSSQSKGSSQGMGVGKPGSSPITKHGLAGPGGSSSGIGSGSKMKPQGGKPPGSLMNPNMKPNISPSHSRSSNSGDKLSSPMKMQQSQVPGTPPSSKAKSPMGSGGGGSGGSKSSGGGSQKPMGGSSSGSTSSSSSSSGSMAFSGGSQAQYGGSGGGSGGGGGGGGGGGPGGGSGNVGGGGGGGGCSSSGGGGAGQNNANNPNAKGKSPSRNKKPSLTAVIDKLKSVGGGGVGEDGCEVGPPAGGTASGSAPGGGGGGGGGHGNVPSGGPPNVGPSKHGSSSQSGDYKRERSDKEAKAKVSVSGGNSGDKKLLEPKTGGGSATGLAKIIISKPDGGSPTIKAKVTLQKTGEGSSDSMRPQISSLKASPLFSGSTPKHDRSSPSHSRSPGYTPLNHDSESESGSSSVAEKSHQNSPSSDDDQAARPLPHQDYVSSVPLGSGEKHKKHKKEKKKMRERDREREREREKEKKKSSSSSSSSSMSMGPLSHPIKADSWSRSPISASESSLSMLGAERPSRPSPMYMRNEDDDLMDSALTGNL